MNESEDPGALVYLVDPIKHRWDARYMAEVECPPIHDGCGWRSRVMPLDQAQTLRPLHVCFSPLPPKQCLECRKEVEA